jgi:hypothetical protein
MGKAHQNHNKTAQPKSETNELATRKKINTMNRKQTPIEISTQIHISLLNSAMGGSLEFQHQNPPALSIQYSPIYSECTLLHNQPQEPRKATNKHCTVKRKILKKIIKPH